MTPPSPSGSASRLRSAGLFTAKLLGAALATFLLVELGLRVVGIGPVTAASTPRNSSEFHADPEVAEAQRRGWIPWPTPIQSSTKIPEHPRGFVEIHRNRCSLREDEEIPFEKPPRTYRILCLGDSHTDGICWNAESYANQLERFLNSAAKAASSPPTAADSRPSPESPIDRMEVINAGFGPSSPYQQVWAYQQVHRRFQPDLVIVGFYAGNDLVELLNTELPVSLTRQQGEWKHTEHAAASSTPATKGSTLDAFKQPFRDYSSTYHALTRIPWLRRMVVKQLGRGDPYRDRLEYATLLHSGTIWQGLHQAYYFQHHPDRWDEAIDCERQVLKILQQQTRQQNAKLCLVVIPTLRQIHPETSAQAIKESADILELSADSLDTDQRACEAVVHLAKELHIPCLDLRPTLRESKTVYPTDNLYFDFDHHLSVRGNQVVAGKLAEFLRTEATLPSAKLRLPTTETADFVDFPKETNRMD